ncbi:MAG: DUF4834 family protein [Cyclobacteriaceae bacterium]|nr:DUF4834 family protein [Cyclobacteriaceae bacterium]
MLKIIAILVLLYFFFRSIGFVIRLLLGGGMTARNQNPYTNQQQRRQTRDGDLHIDNVPKQSKERKEFRGGDYVDYEEVD